MDCLKTTFQKDKNRKDDLQPHCITCRTQNYKENRERTRKFCLENRDKIKNYEKRNREKTNLCEKNRKESDLNFKLV